MDLRRSQSGTGEGGATTAEAVAARHRVRLSAAGLPVSAVSPRPYGRHARLSTDGTAVNGPLRAKLVCPICDHRTVSHVIGSRPGGRYYWRQRRCAVCGETFTTTERVEPIERPQD